MIFVDVHNFSVDLLRVMGILPSTLTLAQGTHSAVTAGAHGPAQICSSTASAA